MEDRERSQGEKRAAAPGYVSVLPIFEKKFRI
jgi:hypothetical protein